MTHTRILAALTFGAFVSTAAVAAPVTLIDNTTTGLYNGGIGTSLNNTSAAFPTAIDPVASFPTAPDLSAASVALGSWLSNPTAPGGTWGASAQAIPGTWAVGTEDAIIYAFDTDGSTANVHFSFGVDNGIFVWVDGVYMGGFMNPGGPVLGEFQFDIAGMSAGTHHLQVLREDHGGATGYQVSVTGDAAAVPEPGSLALVGAAMLAAGLLRRRR